MKRNANPTPKGKPPFRYEIRIAGTLDHRWSEWFSGVEITLERQREPQVLTTLHCPPLDQASLRGILNKIWDLNLDLVSVRRIPDPCLEEVGRDEAELRQTKRRFNMEDNHV